MKLSFFRSQVDGKAVLICRARGTPAPDIVFQKDSRREPFVQGAQNDARIFQEQARINEEVTVATLTINDLLRTDDGLYNCIASNRRARSKLSPTLYAFLVCGQKIVL